MLLLRHLVPLLALTLGCRPEHAAQQPTTIPQPLLSHAQVTARMEQRILSTNPGTISTRTSDHTLALVFPDGVKAELTLDVGFALCGRRPQDCDAYVDKLMFLIRTDEDHGEDEEDDDGDTDE